MTNPLADLLGDAFGSPDPQSKPQLILQIGDAGSGKTYLAATASEIPGVGKTLIIDTEGSTVGTINNFDPEKIDVAKIWEIENEDERAEKLITILKNVHNISNGYGVIILDSLTQAQQIILKYFDKLSPTGSSGKKDGYFKYTESQGIILQFAEDLKASPAIGIVVAHVQRDKNDDGALVYSLRLEGPKLRDGFPDKPDVVVQLSRGLNEEGDEVTTAVFASSEGRVTKNRFNFPPAVAGATWPLLWQYIDENSNNNKEDK